MNKKIIFVCIGLLFVAKFTAAQIPTTNNFCNKNFCITYPKSFSISNKDGIVNIFDDNIDGAVTISSNANVDINDKQLKKYLLAMYDITDTSIHIKMYKNENVKTFYFEHATENIQWVTKAMLKNNTLNLITINCITEQWIGENKNELYQIFSSFKLK